MNKLRIEAFQFLGGDRSELKKGRPLLGRSEWNTIVDKLASTCTIVFPTHPRNIPSDVSGMSFINLPISGVPGYRAHCVYFSHSITRTFWNVLCFAYREADCPLRELAAVSADDWYRIGTSLTHDSQVLFLPSAGEAVLYPPLPACESSQALFYRFPTAREQLITSAEDNWERCLKEAQEAPVSSLRSQPTPKSIRIEWLRKKKKFFIGVAIGYVLGIGTAPALDGLKDITSPILQTLPTEGTNIPQSPLDKNTDSVEPDSSVPPSSPSTEDTNIPQSPLDENTDNTEPDSSVPPSSPSIEQ